MRKFLLIIFTLSLICLSGNSEYYKILETQNETEISVPELANKLRDFQIVFFGEYHDNTLLHQLEIDLLQAIYSADPRIAVSLEMFERDVQSYLNIYLKGEIKESEFLENSRPWPNYGTDYRPIIEFARIHELSVIAANVPRRYAAEIHRKGLNALDSLSIEEKNYFASEHVILDDEYKTRFIETMQKNMSHDSDSPMGMRMNLDLIYAAQCIKDDTMAESIQQFINNQPDVRIIHYNGDFHSRKHLGTAQKLERLVPGIKTAVIAPLRVLENWDYSPEDLEEADFLILILSE
jgi:uncharacterized iron-regulated protein